MEAAAPYRHPVDYRVCPRAGLVFLLWGAVSLIRCGFEWSGTLGLREGFALLMTLGILLFGAAIRLPEGGARTWLLRAWLVTLFTYGALILVPFVAGN